MPQIQAPLQKLGYLASYSRRELVFISKALGARIFGIVEKGCINVTSNSKECGGF
jgi:hypothetical protein